MNSTRARLRRVHGRDVRIDHGQFTTDLIERQRWCESKAGRFSYPFGKVEKLLGFAQVP